MAHVIFTVHLLLQVYLVFRVRKESLVSLVIQVFPEQMDALDFLDHQVWVYTHSDMIHRNAMTYILSAVSVWVQVLKGMLAFREAQVDPEHQELKEAWEKWDYLVCLNPPNYVLVLSGL